MFTINVSILFLRRFDLWKLNIVIVAWCIGVDIFFIICCKHFSHQVKINNKGLYKNDKFERSEKKVV